MIRSLRRRFRRLSWLAWPAVGALAAGALAFPQHAPQAEVRHVAAASKRPNIVLITTDDQALTDLRWMPNTRRLLGGEGATFTSMLSPHPLCCPARAEILTGQYAQNNGVRSNRRRQHGGYAALIDKQNTVARWLHDAGYQTAFVGKFLNGYEKNRVRPAGWDIWTPLVQRVYNYYDFALEENGTPRRSRGVYSVDAISRRTNDYVRRMAAGNGPFFIWSSQVAPHGECSPQKESSCWAPPRSARRHAHRFRQTTAPDLRDPAFNERNVADKPSYIRNAGMVSRASINRLFRDRIRSLQAVDEAVASTVRTLDQLGELDNTLFMFASDNGYLLGQHRYTGKIVPYEEALRVPMLMRGPGVPAGVRRTQMVSLVDIAPTIVDAAGARAGRVMDGESLLPVARRNAARYSTALIQGGPRSPKETRFGWFYRGVRTPRYTYVRYTKSGFEELYDRKVDPAQLANRAHRRSYAAVLRQMRVRAALLGGCSGWACRISFGPDPSPQRGGRSS